MGAEDLHPGLPRASVQALSRARYAVEEATDHLRVWRHGSDQDYPTAGYDAITRMNQALSHVEHARAAVFEEIAAIAVLLAEGEPETPPPPPAPGVDRGGAAPGAGTSDTGSPGDVLDGSISIATPGAAGANDGGSR